MANLPPHRTRAAPVCRYAVFAEAGNAGGTGDPSAGTFGDSGLEDEVRVLRRELQASVDAFEASNEELKASNEEVLSVNEELQSANEELETSKEELQSLNEELTTVNSQLQAKILEFEHITNDLSNLLSSTSIAVVFLDTQLLVRRFTPAVQDLLELIPTDIGRSISDLAPKFSTAEGHESAHGMLRNTARAVLDNLTPVEMEVRSNSGRWYLQRTLPYRTADNHIEGVVLTFVDISGRKNAEQSIAQMQARLRAVLEQMPAAIVVADAPSGRIMHANRRAAELFGQPYPPPFIDAEWKSAVLTFKGRHPDGRLCSHTFRQLGPRLQREQRDHRRCYRVLGYLAAEGCRARPARERKAAGTRGPRANTADWVSVWLLPSNSSSCTEAAFLPVARGRVRGRASSSPCLSKRT